MGITMPGLIILPPRAPLTATFGASALSLRFASYLSPARDMIAFSARLHHAASILTAFAYAFAYITSFNHRRRMGELFLMIADKAAGHYHRHISADAQMIYFLHLRAYAGTLEAER